MWVLIELSLLNLTQTCTNSAHMVQNEAYVRDGFDSGKYHGASVDFRKFPCSEIL